MMTECNKKGQRLPELCSSVLAVLRGKVGNKPQSVRPLNHAKLGGWK